MGCLWTKDSLLFLPSFARPLLLLSRLVSCSLSASISKARRVIQSAFLSLTLSFYRFVKRSFASEKETTAHVPRFNAFFYFKLKQQISTRPSHHHRDAGSELFFDPFFEKRKKMKKSGASSELSSFVTSRSRCEHEWGLKLHIFKHRVVLSSTALKPHTCPFNPILFPRESMSEGQCGVDEQMHKEKKRKKDILQKQNKRSVWTEK